MRETSTLKIISAQERGKYQRIWALDSYHAKSPGADMLPMFERVMRPELGARILDIGAGDGAASRILKDKGYQVEAFDLIEDDWPHADIPIHAGSIWSGLPRGFDIGYCCDVMEHLPTQFVGLAVARILESCRSAFFSIAFREDLFGRNIGEPLHLTVQPLVWWRDTLREIGHVLDARDLIGEGVFHVGR
jgi:2-polyprenyl-3-methyl-5-hydroxy-6-metoxy-1,4-benzoquinol methylase